MRSLRLPGRGQLPAELCLLFCFFNKRIDERGFPPDLDVIRFEIVLEIHAESALGQIDQVAHRRLDLVSFRKIFFNCFCF